MDMHVCERGGVNIYASYSIQMLVRIASASRSIDQVLYLAVCDSRDKRHGHTAAAVARALKGSTPLYHFLIRQICRASSCPCRP